jgi:thioredoxin-like negative regulator of GroEL
MRCAAWGGTAIVITSLLWATSAGADPLRTAALDGGRYVLAEFTSATCPACEEMQPIVQSVLAGHPEVQYRAIDADFEPTLSRDYGVKCVPVYVVLSPKGEVLFNDVGMRTAEELEQILKRAGAAPADSGTKKP